jgi:uncharacterized protein (TIGR00369 family)
MGDGDLTPKPPSASRVELVQLMRIDDTNLGGSVHGGVIMKLADTAAGLAAIKHSGGLCVTAAVDEMAFRAPVRIGDLVTARASVNDVGRTSLEVGVSIEAEHVITGERVHTSTAYFVFVAIDDEGRPRPVPPLRPETDDDRRRQREARIRRDNRLAHREAIRAHRTGGGSGTSPGV